MTREHVSAMFFKGEVEAEIRDIPSKLSSVKFNTDAEFELYMQHVEKQRVSTLYEHISCSECRLKGK